MKDKMAIYKIKRDGWRECGNKFLETFYQILIVQETEKSKFSFHKKNELKQHWDILYNLLDEILGITDVNYQRGIYYEVILSGIGIRLSGKEKECQICNSYFEESGNWEYVHGAYGLHLSGILEMAKYDVEAAQLYVDNLLVLLAVRYGMNNWQYAKMKLYIMGECYYQYKREKFISEMKKDYGYFKEYAVECDSLFCHTLALYAYLLGENEDKDYGLWMARCEEAVEQKQGDKLYCKLKCEIAWIKARVLANRNQDRDALKLLQEAITKYLEQDYESKEPFYGYVYLMVANVCHKLQYFKQMIHYAQKGLAICERLKLTNSELYYNLYIYVGILYMVEKNWGEAEKLFRSSIEEIVRKFGKENENYVTYMSNLGLIALKQGKNAYSYLQEIRNVKNEELRKRFRALFNNELNHSIACGDSIERIGRIYKHCIKNMEGVKDEWERTRLDTLYLSAIINLGEMDDDKADSLMKELEGCYVNNFTDELAVTYWNSRLIWEWNRGNLRTALEIAERIVQEMQEGEYEKNRHIVINYIQLLIVDGQADRSKSLILSMIDLLHNRILEIGYGNIFPYVFSIRLLISLYIQVLKGKGDCLSFKEKEAKRLLEKIMYCKTIEREMKSSLGKYGDDEDRDFYYFKQAHRKLAALEMGRKVELLDKEEYARKRMKCLLEMAEHEASLNNRIPFDKMIHEYRFEDIKVPQNAVCIEYFAYYNFQSDIPISKSAWAENENGIYSYLALVLSKDKGKVEIVDIVDIPIEGILEDKIGVLFDTANRIDKCEEEKGDELREYFKQLFAMPVLKYAKGKEKIYLGLDYVQQMLPMDLLFCNYAGEPMDIMLVDSLCYVEDDLQICIEESEVLVIGNPQLALQGRQEAPLLCCGERECIKIAELLDTKAYLGREAKQKVLWGKEPKDIIHISTHGMWSETEENVLFQDNLFIDSFLMFAGFEDWAKGRRDKDYGNGIVSGDDFLFMDLSKTKLVVLSACVSGLGYTRGLGTLHGMRWAIGAAGAENSITTLWEVSDDATAILMILFYRNLRTMPIGKALYEAKRRLRTITIGELRKDYALEQIVEVSQQQYSGDYDVPYAHWRYWAGFVCYHR